MALPAAGVTVLLWYMWLQTLLLLLAQLITNLLCHSLISMVDGFHTIYLFTQMTVFLFNREGTGSGVPTTDTAPTSPPSAPPSLTPPSPGSSPSLDAPSQTPPHRLPSPPSCGLSFPKLRARSVEVFSSALCLATLSGTYFLEIIPQMVAPSEKYYPLVWTVVGAISIFHNTLVLVLTWARVLQGRTKATATARPDHESMVETGGDRPGRDGAGPGRDATAAVQSNGAGSLIFSNPGALHPDTRVPGQGAGGDPGTPEHGVPLWDASDDHVPRSRSDEYAGEVRTESRWLGFLRAAWVPFQDLFAAVLAVIYGLVMLLAVPDCVPASLSCTPLVHVDVAFSALAIVVLLVCSVPQVHWYGLLLLQASPTSVSVSELSGKITCIPGVESLHDFHVWQLTDTYTVASVHVQCQEGFQNHRCGDLILAITKVIHGVGISCCTIQPEFALPPPVSSDAGPDEAPSTPGSPQATPACGPAYRPACRLACKNECEKKMCCSLPEHEPHLQDK